MCCLHVTIFMVWIDIEMVQNKTELQAFMNFIIALLSFYSSPQFEAYSVVKKSISQPVFTTYFPPPNSCLCWNSLNRTLDLVSAYVVVLNPMQVDTIQTYGTMLRSKAPEEEQWRDGSFVLLQLVNGLKTLQAQGIEEAPLSLSTFVLCREERDPQPRLCILQVLGIGPASEEGSLCQCALAAMQELLPVTAALTPLISDLLHKERAVSLSQVKSVLEFSLWGPADVALGTQSSDRELVLQRWLDLERATVLHGLVHTRVELTAFEECHLLFLVRTSAKMMCEASVLLDSDSNAPETTSF
jgi:hypothetical protein